jgi:F420-0:gamma-glutamyl ligase
MNRTMGTVVRGIRTPVIREGDSLVDIVVDSIDKCQKIEGFAYNDRDVVGITEAVVARAQGNYASIATIGDDVRKKINADEFAVVYPILSRNRFAVCLKGIAMAARKIKLVFSYPADEVGNHLFDKTKLYDMNINPWHDAITLGQYREMFGYPTHNVTGMDYVAYYKEIIEEFGAECEIMFCNDFEKIAGICDTILLCSIHDREWQKNILLEKGAKNVLLLTDIMNSANESGEGYNEDYGLLGSNKSTEETVKLFPRDCETFTSELQERLRVLTGKNIEVLIYGDGAFKDPVCFIWELADPVVSPAYSKGLEGVPNEIKLKYLADKEYASLSGDKLTEAVKNKVGAKNGDPQDSMLTMGTTPRRIIDLLGSLCDLTSGSGDKGTPIVYIQGYFDNFSN